MSKPLTFTVAIYRALRRDPDMPETCRQWHAAALSPENRVIKFAGELYRDVKMLLRSAAMSYTADEVDNELLLAVADQVVLHVVWSRIARQLMKDFPAGPLEADGLRVPAVGNAAAGAVGQLTPAAPFCGIFRTTSAVVRNFRRKLSFPVCVRKRCKVARIAVKC